MAAGGGARAATLSDGRARLRGRLAIVGCAPPSSTASSGPGSSLLARSAAAWFSAMISRSAAVAVAMSMDMGAAGFPLSGTFTSYAVAISGS